MRFFAIFNMMYLKPGAVRRLIVHGLSLYINTGDLVKRLRRENHSGFANKIALLVAKNFKATEFFAGIGLGIGSGINSVFGKKNQ